MITIALLIGNSDDKLSSQRQWSEFFHEIDGYLRNTGAKEIHFSASSAGASPWQNACWVFATEKDQVEHVMADIQWIRLKYHQESVAVLAGETLFL